MNEEFIEFLATNGAIKFGEFKLKSGRISPYFINTGVLCTGGATYILGKHFAKKIEEVCDSKGDKIDVIYGPAYKGIPLGVATSIAFLKEMGKEKGWLFDRKERKIRGDSGVFVGFIRDEGMKIVIVDDVFTTGGTKVEAIEKLEKGLKAEVKGIIIAVDRQEIGRTKNATTEFTEQTGVPVYSIVTITEVFDYLKNKEINGKIYVDDGNYEEFVNYRKKYGEK